MAFYVSAGVYPEITDLSQVVEAAGTSVGAAVIESKWGPDGVVTRVTASSFLDKFGTEGVNHGHQTVRGFFKRAATAYVVRVVNGAKYAGATVKATGHGTITAWATGKTSVTSGDLGAHDLMHVAAVYKGAKGTLAKVKISRVDALTKEFDLEVWTDNLDGVAVLREKFTVTRVEGVKDGYGRSKYVEDVINGKSLYVQVVDNPTVDSATLPTVSGLVVLAGGDDGASVTDAQIAEAWALFNNPDDVPVNLLLNAGYATYTVQNAMIEVCENRKDAFAILDTPYDMTPEEAVAYVQGDQNGSVTTSRYAAIYHDWIKDYDSTQLKTVEIPPSGYVAGAFAYTDDVADVWFAPAGIQRGTLQVLGVKTKLEQTDRDYLYENHINPIRFKSGVGVSIWGQRNLQSYNSALDRVAVVRLIQVIQKSVAIALDAFVFEPNDEFTRNTITSVVNSFLGRIEARRGLTAFQVVCDSTNNTPATIDANELNVTILLQPTRAAEIIRLPIVITRTGASFDEAVAAAA